MIGKRIVAFDIGDKRIGVAVSDPFNGYAMPCDTYFRVGKFEEDLSALIAVAKEKGAGKIVCGLPFNYDGTPSVQTEKTLAFIEALKARTDIPVETEDERFTTIEARKTQIAGGITRDKRKKTIDSIAASYILESYLEKQKSGKGETMNEEKEITEEEENILELEDDEGNVVKLYHIATIEYKGGLYCCFQKAEPETEEEEDEVVIYSLEGEDDDKRLVPVEDDQLLDEVFAEFCKEYEEYENSDEAMKLDGAE